MGLPLGRCVQDGVGGYDLSLNTAFQSAAPWGGGSESTPTGPDRKQRQLAAGFNFLPVASLGKGSCGRGRSSTGTAAPERRPGSSPPAAARLLPLPPPPPPPPPPKQKAFRGNALWAREITRFLRHGATRLESTRACEVLYREHTSSCQCSETLKTLQYIDLLTKITTA